MNFQTLLGQVDEADVDQEIQDKLKYASDEKQRIWKEIEEKISSMLSIKKRKLDYNAYMEVVEILKMFSISSKNLIDIYFNLLEDQQKMLLLNFSDVKQLIGKIRFCLLRSVHNMNRTLIKENQTADCSETPAAISSSEFSEQKKSSKTKKKRKKGKNSKMVIDQTGGMYKWILENFQNPYPSQQVKQKLSEQSKISLSKVNYWFINMRQRTLKKLMSAQNSGIHKRKKTQKGDKYYQNSQVLDSSVVGCQQESGSNNS